MLVRHGLMCVGPTGGGKTTIYEVLKDAIIQLHKGGHKHYFYQPVLTYVLNPKVCSNYVHTHVQKVQYVYTVCTIVKWIWVEPLSRRKKVVQIQLFLAGT